LRLALIGKAETASRTGHFDRLEADSGPQDRGAAWAVASGLQPVRNPLAKLPDRLVAGVIGF
jgi:hypothetical protein